MSDDTKTLTLTAYRYRSGLGSHRFRGLPANNNAPVAVEDLYIQKWAMGSPPPPQIEIIIRWKDAPDGSQEIHDDT